MAEFAVLAAWLHQAASWSWPAAVGAAGLIQVGTWLPLHLLVVRPASQRFDDATRALDAAAAREVSLDALHLSTQESLARLRAVFDSSPNGVVLVEPESALPIDFNDTMPRLLGYSRTEFAQLPLSHYVCDTAETPLRASIDRAIRGAVETAAFTCRRRTGTTFDASFVMQVLSVGGRPAVSCYVRDTSLERNAERALHQTNSKMQSMISELECRNQERTILTEMGGVLQACVTTAEAFSVVSRFGKRLFPGTSGALYVYSHSRTDLELAAWWSPPTGGFDAVMEPADCWGLRQGHPYDRSAPSSSMPCPHADDDDEASYLCVPLTAQGETLGVLHLRATGGDPCGDAPTLVVNRPLVTTVCDQVTLGIANLRLRETLRHQSIHDPLTGLYNRRYMEEALQREIPRAARNGKPLAVVMADLDHFKVFNDTYGHEAGDAVLTELGLLLKTGVRASDMACRYGGEEFALVLPETTIEGTLTRVEAIRSRVAALRVTHRNRVLGGLTLSLGVALMPEHGETAEELLRAADKALYRAKQAGRNQALLAEAEDPPARSADLPIPGID